MSRGKFYFSVDLDRDVNVPLPGRVAAGSLDRGSGPSPRWSSAEKGLGILLDVLDEVGIRATFFVEGRTAEVVDCSGISGHSVGFHGYDHEDLSGESTGVELSSGDVGGILRKGFEAVSDNVSRPVCFRAPYMVFDPEAISLLPGMGIRADSSEYRLGGCDPYDTGLGVVEYPVPKSRDASGKPIAAYLWPMHEGRRGPEDYVDMAAGMDTFALATHTWHMCERRDGGVMDASEQRLNAGRVREVLTGVLDLGFSPAVICRSRVGYS
jgi:peptidoglycan/xylan/chitin deacetylase (PgdA/CDA1 family)